MREGEKESKLAHIHTKKRETHRVRLSSLPPLSFSFSFSQNLFESLVHDVYSRSRSRSFRSSSRIFSSLSLSFCPCRRSTSRSQTFVLYMYPFSEAGAAATAVLRKHRVRGSHHSLSLSSRSQRRGCWECVYGVHVDVCKRRREKKECVCVCIICLCECVEEGFEKRRGERSEREEEE